MNIVVGRDQKKVLPIAWWGDEEKLEWKIKLAQPGAEIEVWMILMGRGEKKVQIDMQITHAAKNTKSKVIVRGVLMEKTSVDFNGLVKIMPGARGADAWLGVNLLLLSRRAMGRAVPNLEIGENEVKAGHGATVGKINPQEIFYLQSRGLTENEAKSLIVQGFLENLVVNLPPRMAKRAKEELQSI